MSQETTNQFSDGLIMDLNPLTTPNNVLTNCLNGTFITFNGNEFVLQNDMGNGRVETAYLPSGYVPVGIKEHGGIIYVASYNPLTNRSQIGSFPSPERNISSEELNTPKTSVNFNSFFSGDKDNCQLNSTVYRLQLSTHVIRSGDKFSIMVQSSDTDLFKWISNWNNTEIIDEERKIKYRHNKLLTLQIATEDFSGNLIDITEQLKRTTGIENEVITFSANDSPKIQFNTGQFLQYSGEGGSSENIENIRNSKALNTYNNKIFGNLYLVATLNTITNYSVSVYGTKSPDENVKDCTLTFEITYDYNCPDGSIYEDDEITGMLKEDACNESDYNPTNVMKGNILKLTYSGADIFKDKLVEDDRKDQENNNYIATYHKAFYLTESDTDSSKGKYLPKYNELTELYTLDNSYNVNLSTNTGILSYELTPEMTYGKLDGLKVTGSINLDLLGSGLTSLNVWKYYINDGGNTDITWGMQSYPKYGEEVKRVIFDFIELASESIEQTLEIGGRESYNGVFTNAVQLEIGKIYIVRISIFQDLITRQWQGVVKKNEINTPERVWWEYEEDEEHLSTEWKAIIMDPNYYNSLYSSEQDFINITNRVLELQGTIPYTIQKNSYFTTNNLDFSTDSLIEGSVESTINVKIDYNPQYTINSDVFSIDNKTIDSTYSFNTITGDIPDDLEQVNDQFTLLSNMSIQNPYYSSEGSKNVIINSDTDFNVIIEVPIHATRQQVSRFCEYCYAPLAWDPWNMLAATSVYEGVGQFYFLTPWHIDSGGAESRGIATIKNNTSLPDFWGDSFRSNSTVDYEINCRHYRITEQMGIQPQILLFGTVEGASSRNSLKLHTVNANGWKDNLSYVLVAWRNNNNTYTIIGFQAGIGYNSSSLNTPGNIIYNLIHNLLEKIYIYKNFNATVTGYFINSSKYYNDFKAAINIIAEVNASFDTSDVQYKSFNYIEKYNQTLNNLRDSTNLDQSSYDKLASFFSINSNNYHSLINITVPVSVAGSSTIYNSCIEDLNNFRNSVVAVVNGQAVLRLPNGSGLVQNNMYYLYDSPNGQYIDFPPSWVSENFTLVDGLPRIRLQDTVASYEAFVSEEGEYRISYQDFPVNFGIDNSEGKISAGSISLVALT